MEVKIVPNGRMSLPAHILKRLGLSVGGPVFLEEWEDGVVICTAAQAVARAQELAGKFSDRNEAAGVSAFLEERVAESGE